MFDSLPPANWIGRKSTSFCLNDKCVIVAWWKVKMEESNIIQRLKRSYWLEIWRTIVSVHLPHYHPTGLCPSSYFFSYYSLNASEDSNRLKSICFPIFDLCSLPHILLCLLAYRSQQGAAFSIQLFRGFFIQFFFLNTLLSYCVE